MPAETWWENDPEYASKQVHTLGCRVWVNVMIPGCKGPFLGTIQRQSNFGDGHVWVVLDRGGILNVRDNQCEPDEPLNVPEWAGD